MVAVVSGCATMVVALGMVPGGAAPAPVFAAAAVRLSPTSGPPATWLSLRGSGFEPGEALTVTFDGVEVARIRARSDGGLAGPAGRVPASARPGPHVVRVSGGNSGGAASAEFLLQTDFPQFKFDYAKTSVNPYETVLGVSNVGQLRLLWRAHAYFGPEPPLYKGRRLSGSPVVAGGVVYVGSYDGRFYAFPTECSTLCRPLWRADLATHTQGTAAVADGVVYIGSSGGEGGTVGHVYAFPTSCTTPCQPLWVADTTGPVDTGPVVQDGRVYVSDDGGTLNVYPTTCATPCQPLWYGHPPTINEFDSSPTIADGRVWVGSSSGKLFAWSLARCGQVSGLCPVTWSEKPGGDPRRWYIDVTAAAQDGAIYFANFQPEVFSYPTTCTRACPANWEGETGGTRIESSPALYNGRVYMSATSDPTVYVFPVDCTTPCAPIGQYALGMSGTSASPTIANGVLYLGNEGGRMAAYDAACLTECAALWKYGTGGNIFSTAAVVDGRVYVGSNDGYLYAFGLP